jgi:hypothetical protein
MLKLTTIRYNSYKEHLATATAAAAAAAATTPTTSTITITITITTTTTITTGSWDCCVAPNKDEEAHIHIDLFNMFHW